VYTSYDSVHGIFLSLASVIPPSLGPSALSGAITRVMVLCWLLACAVAPVRIAQAEASDGSYLPHTERRAEVAAACAAEREKGAGELAGGVAGFERTGPSVEPSCEEIASPTAPLDAHISGWSVDDTYLRRDAADRTLARKAGCSLYTLDVECDKSPRLGSSTDEIVATANRAFVPALVPLVELPRPPGA
jgi:hypothetical protein